MLSDEWDAKAWEFALTLLRPQVAGYMIATDHLETAENPYWRGQIDDAKAAIKAVLDGINTAAERRGIERAAKKLVLLQAVADAAESVVEAIAERHDTKKPPLKYTVPWGAVSTLMAKLAALATPMADAGPTEPAGASDREGT